MHRLLSFVTPYCIIRPPMPADANFASFQAELGRLVEVFGRNLSHYKSADYDEAGNTSATA